MRKFSVCFSIMFFYCVSDTAFDPESVSLISPKNLESCTNAVRINDTDRQVRFEWTEALNVDQYELIVENSITKEKFISNTLNKIKTVRDLINASGKDIDLEVDGGINLDTIADVYNAGANVFVAGSAIFGSENYEETINDFRDKIT